MAPIKTVRLAGSGIDTTALGFGCSNLLGDKTREEGLSLLNTAYDAGVRHFDVARYYGYGDAEGLVGDLAARYRDRITITTKFGLQPIKAVAGARTLVAGVRRIMRRSAWVRNIVRRRVPGLVQHGRFDVGSARASLETSLRELRTDHIDILLLHEPDVPDCRPELLDFLLDAQSKGIIRSFGVGGAFARVEAICRTLPLFTEIAQFDSQPFDDRLSAIRVDEPSLRGSARSRITFGSMAAVEALSAKLLADAGLARRAAETLDHDLADKQVLAGAGLAWSMRRNPEGIVLFRSAAPSRIISNVSLAGELAASERLDRFAACVGWCGSTHPAVPEPEPKRAAK